MISERRFCVSYTSVWADVLPYSEGLIRRINLGTERFIEPMPQLAPATMTGVVNEAAYRVAAEAAQKGRRVSTLAVSDIDSKLRDAAMWLRRDRSSHTEEAWRCARNDSKALARNIELFVKTRLSGQVIYAPRFKGCGIVDECEGDLWVGDTLVEIKSGDRGFLSIDLRQLLTYCALAYAAGSVLPVHVCLVNPRVGVFWMSELDEVIRDCGVPSSFQLLEEIGLAMMDLAVSTL